MMNFYDEYVILQLSDLHIFENIEWKAMQQAYLNLPYYDKISCILITGDLHQFGDNYEKTHAFLNNVIEQFNLTKKDIFIIPGNHDSEKCENKESYTFYIDKNVDENPDCYKDYFVKGKLIDCFNNYNEFITNFYKGYSDMIQRPEQVQIIKWKNNINFVLLNTAMICNGDNKLDQIVDVNGLSNFYHTLDKSIPSIILAHHSINNIHQSHRNLLIRYITDWKVSAYLCGDTHKMQYSPIMTYGNSGENIPCIVCGKSAPEVGDKYSDLGCILYVKERASNEIKTIPFDWDNVHKRFNESTIFNCDSGYLNFKLLTSTSNSEIKKVSFYL